VSANAKQVGGTHYKDTGGECPKCGHRLEHWDIAWMFRFNCFQYIITKWLWRKKGPEGRPLLADLEKVVHAAQKYIEVIQREEEIAEGLDPARKVHFEGEEPGPEYVNQD
jgi:hypothetical protein